jgi:hypothetical protein
MDMFDALIVTGVIATVGSTIIINKFLNPSPTQTTQPQSVKDASPTTRSGRRHVQTPIKTSVNAAPVAQNNPITEAAYNIPSMVPYAPAFGRHAHQSPNPPVLPI